MLSILKITNNSIYTTKSIESGKRRQTEDSIIIPLVGRLTNPVVHCTKAIKNETYNQLVIPLAVRIDQPL